LIFRVDERWKFPRMMDDFRQLPDKIRSLVPAHVGDITLIVHSLLADCAEYELQEIDLVLQVIKME
jgi:hypothetical protein